MLAQPARGAGYRFTVDALLLARHAMLAGRARHAADLGAGVGAVGLSLLTIGGAERVTLVERDAEACALARANAAPFHERASVVAADVGSVDRSAIEGCDVVVCNPPYTPNAAGKPGAVAASDAARRGDLDAFVAAAARLAADVAHFVYPAARVPSLILLAERVGLFPVVVRWVHARTDLPARVALVTFARSGEKTAVAAPWIEHQDDGPSPDLEAFVRGTSLFL